MRRIPSGIPAMGDFANWKFHPRPLKTYLFHDIVAGIDLCEAISGIADSGTSDLVLHIFLVCDRDGLSSRWITKRIVFEVPAATLSVPQSIAYYVLLSTEI